MISKLIELWVLIHTSEEASGEWRCVELGEILYINNNFEDILSLLRQDWIQVRV